MDTYTQLQSRIFRLLCVKAGEQLNQRTIAGILNVSPTAVAKALKGLETLIKINKSKTMNLKTAELNRDSHRVIELKRVENLKLIYESNLADYLSNKFPGCTIILFGSYSQGEDIKTSDVDIAVIGSKEKELDLTKFEKLIERGIIIHYYKSLNNINKDLRENILRGITL